MVRFGGVALPDWARFDGKRDGVRGPIVPNGAYSTTPLNCLSRVHSDRAGDSRFEGQSVNATPVLGCRSQAQFACPRSWRCSTLCHGPPTTRSARTAARRPASSAPHHARPASAPKGATPARASRHELGPIACWLSPAKEPWIARPASLLEQCHKRELQTPNCTASATCRARLVHRRSQVKLAS